MVCCLRSFDHLPHIPFETRAPLVVGGEGGRRGGKGQQREMDDRPKIRNHRDGGGGKGKGRTPAPNEAASTSGEMVR